MSILHVTCREASRILSKREDAPLSFRERLQLWMHLRICDACRRVARQFSAMRLAVQKWRDGD